MIWKGSASIHARPESSSAFLPSLNLCKGSWWQRQPLLDLKCSSVPQKHCRNFLGLGDMGRWEWRKCLGRIRGKTCLPFGKTPPPPQNRAGNHWILSSFWPIPVAHHYFNPRLQISQCYFRICCFEGQQSSVGPNSLRTPDWRDGTCPSLFVPGILGSTRVEQNGTLEGFPAGKSALFPVDWSALNVLKPQNKGIPLKSLVQFLIILFSLNRCF